jgi:uncharacterized damage-inducible protein DinB
MKDYLIKTFRYNDWANKKLIDAITTLPEKGDVLKLFSHLITSQDKWHNRITHERNDSELTWFGLVFSVDELEKEWERSVKNWIGLLERSTEKDLENKIEFKRASDNKPMRVKLVDLALQLNYHSIHHRAQINSLISKQGQKPPLTDYIFTAMEETGLSQH